MTDSKFNIRFNFPKGKVGVQGYINLIITIVLVTLLLAYTSLNIWEAILIGCLPILAVAIVIAVRVRLKFHNFLKSVGEPATIDDFYQGNGYRTLVPFVGGKVYCSARIDTDALILGKPNHYRKLSLGHIDSFEFQTYLGHRIAKVNLYEQPKLDFELFIPWHDEFEVIAKKYFETLGDS